MARVLPGLALALIVVTAAIRYDLSAGREFDPDELQHLHAAWCVASGLVPYRDFYEHHMPGLPMLLAATLPLANGGQPLDVTLAPMWRARTMMWVWSLLSVVLTWTLAWRLAGTAVAWAATALFTLSIIFTGKGLEIRPDGPATALWLASLLALAIAAEGGGARRAWYAISGLALGLALLFTQKLLLAGPGLAAFTLWMWTRRDDPRSRSSRVGDTLAQLVALAVPLAAAAAWFAVHGAAGAFLDATLLQNLGWTPETTASSTLAWFALRDPLLAVLGIAGAVTTAWVVAAVPALLPRTRAGLIAVFAVGASLGAGLFVIPAPYPQYLLPVLPLLAIWAGVLLVGPGVPAAARLVGVGGAFLFALAWARPFFMAAWAYPAFFAAALLLAATLRARPPLAAAVVVAAASLYPLQQLRWMQGLSNDRQIRVMAAVHTLTSAPGATVLDGFSGYGWFRLHAWRYHFLHGGVRGQMTPADRRELADGLASGGIAPSAVLNDTHLQAVSSDVQAALARRFTPTATEPVWAPRAQ